MDDVRCKREDVRWMMCVTQMTRMTQIIEGGRKKLREISGNSKEMLCICSELRKWQSVTT